MYLQLNKAHILFTIKNNVDKTKELLQEWASELMLQRKGKTYEAHDFAEAQQTLQQLRDKAIGESSGACCAFPKS